MLGLPPWLRAGSECALPAAGGGAQTPGGPDPASGGVGPAAACPVGELGPAGPAAATIRAVDRDGAVVIAGPAALAGLAPGDAVSVVVGPGDALVVTAGGSGRLDRRGRLRLPLWWRRRHLHAGHVPVAVAVVFEPTGRLLVVPAARLAPLIRAGLS